MARSYTGTDFEHLSWHDCHVWRIDFHAGDPAARDWTSDLVLDVDFSHSARDATGRRVLDPWQALP